MYNKLYLNQIIKTGKCVKESYTESIFALRPRPENEVKTLMFPHGL
jgi:hypothetical protein